MEFKLNKIDTDIRRRMQEEIKEDKVHSGKNIDEKRDFVKEKEDILDEELEKKKKKYLKQQSNNKRYITIDGVKYGESAKIVVEKIEEINEVNAKGRILDTKK